MHDGETLRKKSFAWPCGLPGQKLRGPRASPGRFICIYMLLNLHDTCACLCLHVCTGSSRNFTVVTSPRRQLFLDICIISNACPPELPRSHGIAWTQLKAAPLNIYVSSKPTMVSPPAQQPAEQEEEAREGDVVVEAEAGADEAAEEDVEEKVETEEEEAVNETERRELCDAEGQKLRGTWNLKFLAHTAV